MDGSGIFKSATQFGLGVAGLVLITFAAVRLDLQPGAVSLLYLIAVVFVSLRAGIVSSIAVSFVAVFLLQYYFVPLFSPPGIEESSRRGGKPCFPGHRLGDLRDGFPRPKSD